MRLGVLLFALGCSYVPSLGTVPPPAPEAPAADAPLAQPPGPARSPRQRRHAPGPETPSVAQVIDLEFEGTPRRYRVIPPDDYSDDRDWPVLLGFHGGGPGNTGKDMEVNWVEQRGKGLFLVFPDGIDGNWFAPADPGSASDRDPLRDVRFAEAVVDDLRERYRIDRGRIYASGFSNGAMLVFAIACNRPQAFAGFATVGAAMTEKTLEGCSPNAERPVVHIQGTLSGFDGKVIENHGIRLAGAEASISRLATAYGCEDRPRRDPLPARCARMGGVERRSYASCRGKGKIDFYVIEGGRHQWPGKTRDPCAALDASEAILERFGLGR